MGSSERFSYEWEKYNQIVPEYREQFYKWVAPLKEKDFKNKTILDVGCGTCRNAYWMLEAGAKKVVCLDKEIGILNVCQKNLKEKYPDKFKITLLSANDIILLKEKFDYVVIIGVLHHLRDPVDCLKQSLSVLKKNGKIVLWVYGYEGNEWIVRYINPIRKITSKLPIKLTHALAYIPSSLLYLFLGLGFGKGPYLNQLRNFKFWHIHSIVFDQLLPEIANYWKKEQVEDIVNIADGKIVSINPVNNNSWAVTIKKNVRRC